MKNKSTFIDALKHSLRNCAVDFDALDDYYNRNGSHTLLKLQGKNLPIEEGRQVGHALFSSDNFFPLLERTIRLFLSCKQYLFLAEIISMAISTISYCNVKYVSFQKGMYSAEERQFDRFMEMLHTCEVEEQLYLPMFICSLQPTSSNEQLYKWADPAMEYLVRYAQNNYDGIASIIEKDLSLSYAYEILFKADRNRTVNQIYKLIKQKGAKKSTLKPLLKPYINYLFDSLSADLDSPLAQTRQNAVSILLMFKSEPNIFGILRRIFENETSKTIRNALKKELNLVEPEPELNSIEQIEQFCSSLTVKNSLPHKLSVCYNNEKRTPRTVLNALYTLSGQSGQSVIHAKKIASFINGSDLQRLASQLFDELDNSSKTKSRVGAYCFCLMFGSDESVRLVLEQIGDYLKKKNTFTVKLISALGASNETGRRFLFELNRNAELAKLYQKELAKAYSVSAVLNNCSVEDIIDSSLMAINLDGVTLTDTLEVVCEDGDRADLKEEIQKQIQRFFHAFTTFRIFKGASFVVNITSNTIFERIASTLFWGRYDKNLRLIDVFIVHDKGIYDLNNNAISINDNDTIALLHPCELDYKYDFLKKLQVFQAFEQIKRKAFLISQQDAMQNRISYFYMNIIDLETLLKRAQRLGFKLLKDSEGVYNGCYLARFGYLARLEFTLKQNAVYATMLKIYEPENSGKKDPEFKTSAKISKLLPRTFSEFMFAFEELLR